MRPISHIVLHCTATRQDATIESIKRYWKDVNGWKSPGYHFIVEATGKLTQLAHISAVTNGVKGYNQTIINIAYIGGVDKSGRSVDNRTCAQKNTLNTIVCLLKKQFPEAIICGHKDFPYVAKDCPCFNAKNEYKCI